MLERRMCWLIVWLMGSLCAQAQAQEHCAELVVTGNPEYPPYLWRDPNAPGHLIGANVDRMHYLGSKLGVAVQVRDAGPWPRAQEEVRLGRVDGIAGYFRTDQREQDVDFIQPAFLSTQSMVWVRRDEALDYRQWSDLKGHTGGTLTDNSYGQAFDDYAAANLDLEPVPSANQAFEKLLHKRNDYLIYERYPGAAMAQQLGIDQALRVLEPPISSEAMYLALSKASPCNTQALREKLTELMHSLMQGDLAEQWLAHNLDRWKGQHPAQP